LKTGHCDVEVGSQQWITTNDELVNIVKHFIEVIVGTIYEA
jgi:hypothetical protein